MIALDKIRIDGGTQTREKLNTATVDEYAEAYSEGAKFPPVTLFFDGASYWLADGFHRYFGAKKAKVAQIHEEVTPGTVRDAILYSLSANSSHGLRRSNKDKHKAVETLLADPEWKAWSASEIARQCCVTRQFVESVRKSHSALLHDSPPGKQKVTRNGTTYEQKKKGSTADDKPKDPPNDAPAPAPQYTELDAAKDQVAELQNALSLAVQGDLPEEAKNEAISLVDGLRAEIKTLEAALKAMTISRDNFQNQVAQLKKQCEMQRKELAKLKAA